MYWRFGFHSTSSIDTLLEKPDVPVESILEDEDLLQECKSQNARLVQYLQRPDVLRTLFGYVTGDIDVEPRSSYKYPYLAAEVLCSDIWSIVETCLEHSDELLTPFWDTVLSKTTDDLLSNPVMPARFTKINSVFLAKKPAEMLQFIKSVPDVVTKLLAQVEIPAVVDLLFRIVKSDGQIEGAGAVDWLSTEGFVPLLMNLLSPYERPEIHVAVSELLKDIISISCPAPGNVSMTGGMDDAAQDVSVSNRLVRELAAERTVIKLVGFMLGDTEDHANGETSRLWKQSDEPAESFSRSSREENAPLAPPPERAASALVHGTSVAIELIRKNHSDYYEPVLFHTLRNRLIAVQQHQALTTPNTMASHVGSEDRESLETALASLAEEVGIVHLGHLLNAVCDRLDEFQALLRQPRTSVSCSRPHIIHSFGSESCQTAPLETTMGLVVPLTFERLRICELYAELYHTSNMALLNRLPGDGPSYDSEGRLLGGLAGLGELARVSASGPSDASHSDRDEKESELHAARELPVSTSSMDTSSISVDEDMLDEALENAPVDSDLAEAAITDPPVTSIQHSSPRGVDPFQDPDDSGAPLEHDTEETDLARERACSGDRLKQQYLELGILETLLSLFFDYPWNNFLHLVVYDVVHQVLTGRVEEGYNRLLTIHLLKDARLIERILQYQPQGEQSQSENNVRGGFSGHLMLLADDVIQAYDEFSKSMKVCLDTVVPQPEWDVFVARHRLAKEQEKKILGGIRPAAANRRTALFSAQVDEVGGTGATTSSNVTSLAPPTSSNSLKTPPLSSSRQVTAFDQDERDSVLVASPDEEDDDEWGSFASTTQGDAILSFDEEEEDTLAFTPAPSISERVLTIADLNSSFHADIEAKGSTAIFEQWPPDNEAEEGMGDIMNGQ
ncbi:SAPS-domain-containing protein [Dacryopinax primogenitus]|uniref:SAPS-domain-containing protein n=1 Tax=Dacryopinax primogenitus (strain DJM 731) TaxID=1858805 RepID=M5FT75_DACPD|nr:SAPS-domain-containing protein [Dacryopinax primogenitus]EJU00801.1 SAPS-domain-containing protein [Dacryopinax primogenitus]